MPTAPTLVQAAFATNTTGNNVTSGTVSWQTDDVVVVIYGNAGASNANMAAPTNTGTGLSWTQQQSIAAASCCGGALATAVATANSSGTVTAGSVAGPSEHNFIGVYVWRSSLGVGNTAGTATPSSTKTVSITPTGTHSAICWGVFDWNADAVQSETPTSTSHSSGSPGPSATPQKTQDAGNYTYYWCDLDDQTSSGANSYGIGGSNAGPFTIVAIEVKGGADAAGIPWTPKQRATWPDPSEIPWIQRDRRDANTVATAANPLVSPLDTAWQADAGYHHLYNDAHLRSRRQYFQQRSLVSDPSMLAGAPNADPLTLSSRAWMAAYSDRREVPQQRIYTDVTLLATALLEGALLGGADTARHLTAALYVDRREVPQQRAYVSDPSFYPVQGQVGAGTAEGWWGVDVDAFYRQRAYISDPSLLAPPAGPDLDVLLLKGQPIWWTRPAAIPQQPQREADQSAQPVDADPVLLASLVQRTAQTWPVDRREVPQQRPYISDPSSYPAVPPTDPLTLAWGAGGVYALTLYMRAATHTDRRLVPQQRERESDPNLLLTALLEDPLLGAADDLRRHRETLAGWRVETVPAPKFIDLTGFTPADPLQFNGERWRRMATPATHAPRWVLRTWRQALLFQGTAPILGIGVISGGTLAGAGAVGGTLPGTTLSGGSR